LQSGNGKAPLPIFRPYPAHIRLNAHLRQKKLAQHGTLCESNR
jgi:hypothetical protein